MSRGLRHEHGIGALALGAGLPGVVVSIVLLRSAGLAPGVSLALGAIVIGTWLCVALAIPGRVARPFQRLSGVLGSFREGDFSIRARDGGAADTLGLASRELNALGDVLREPRLAAVEASALLAKVVAEIDVVVLACDASGALRLVNRAGERILGARASALLARPATDLGLTALLTGDAPRTLTFPEGGSSWELHRGAFRIEGYLSDVGRFGVTSVILVPTMIQWILRELRTNTYDLSSWRFIIYGSAPSSPALIRQMKEQLRHVDLVQRHGVGRMRRVVVDRCVHFMTP